MLVPFCADSMKQQQQQQNVLVKGLRTPMMMILLLDLKRCQ